MRIFILHAFHAGPWGGGNQFLKGMRDYLQKKGLLTDSLSDADVVLLNSFPFKSERILFQLILQKIRKPNTIIIHRIDGPLSFYRGHGKIVDILIWSLNNLISDGTIFQTEWSRAANSSYQKGQQKYVATIVNAPLPIFAQSAKGRIGKISGKIRLIAVSWSPNWNKGFNYYKYLDDHLDFSRYSMTFVGRSPIRFRNIHIHKPVLADDLVQLLASNDIYITASLNDPCSNALLEALAVGLPAVARASGGHPEIVKEGGVLFSSPEEVLKAIDAVAHNYHTYQSKIVLSTMQDTSERYIDFCRNIIDDIQFNRYAFRHIRIIALLNFFFVFCGYKIYICLQRARRGDATKSEKTL